MQEMGEIIVADGARKPPVLLQSAIPIRACVSLHDGEPPLLQGFC
jgi:hypothetical protein